jgi:hypothetical protein
MSEELADLTSRLIGSSEADRDRALQEVGKRPAGDQRLVLEALFARARLTEDVSVIVQQAVGLAKTTPEVAPDVANGIYEHCWRRLDLGAAVDLAGSDVPQLVDLARKLAADDSIDPQVRKAAEEILAGGSA